MNIVGRFNPGTCPKGGHGGQDQRSADHSKGRCVTHSFNKHFLGTSRSPVWGFRDDRGPSRCSETSGEQRREARWGQG